MSLTKEKKVSKKYARRNFTTVGLLLNLYIFSVLIIPFIFHYYLSQTNSIILDDKFLYFGIYFIIVLFGTMIPFFIMRVFFKVPFKKIGGSVSAYISKLFIQTIVFFTICIVLTYVSNIIFAHFGLEGRLLSSIGLEYRDSYLNNGLFIILLLVVTPIIEEYAFRGVLINVLGKYGKSFALYASAILFALAHFNFSEYLPAFAMGILLGKTSLRYRSIRPSIIVHILFNTFMYLMFVMPASITKYMAYGLAGLFVVSIYLVLSGVYERVYIQKLRSNRITNLVFYSRPTIIFCILLLIAKTIMFMIFQ